MFVEDVVNGREFEIMLAKLYEKNWLHYNLSEQPEEVNGAIYY